VGSRTQESTLSGRKRKKHQREAGSRGKNLGPVAHQKTLKEYVQEAQEALKCKCQGKRKKIQWERAMIKYKDAFHGGERKGEYDN